MKYVDPTGAMFETEVTGLQGDTITSISAGGGTVALGTDQGRVLVWNPGSGAARQVGQLQGAILSAATYGGPVFAIDDSHRSVLFTADGETLEVSRNATPFGAAMSGEYVVSSEATAPHRDADRPGRHLAVPGDRSLPALARDRQDLRPAPRPRPAGVPVHLRPTAGLAGRHLRR